MGESTMEPLARRLDRVERRSRRLRWWVIALAVVIFAPVALELAILDYNLRRLEEYAWIGELYTQGVYLKAPGSAGPGKSSWSNTGVFAFTGGATPGSILKIEGARGTIVLESSILPQLTLYDKRGQGHTRAVLQLDKEGEPSLVFFDKDGKVIWSAP